MSSDKTTLLKQWIEETEDKWDREPSFEVWLCQRVSDLETEIVTANDHIVKLKAKLEKLLRAVDEHCSFKDLLNEDCTALRNAITEIDK
jgi:predicted  nucleic acid-binding Zn-ribbon protein